MSCAGIVSLAPHKFLQRSTFRERMIDMQEFKEVSVGTYNEGTGYFYPNSKIPDDAYDITINYKVDAMRSLNVVPDTIILPTDAVHYLAEQGYDTQEKILQLVSDIVSRKDVSHEKKDVNSKL